MKVSVVIPTFNNQDTIAATVESALTQRFDGEFEVIVVNDGSTDGTRAVLEKFGDRIRLIDQENRGVAPARNAGIAAAAGEYIALLDGDDSWTGDKLAKTVPVLDKNPACVAVFSDVMQVEAHGQGVNAKLRFAAIPAFADARRDARRRPWPALPSATVFRRDTLIAIGGFSEEFKAVRTPGGEDTFMFLLAREHGEIDFVADKLVRYRVSEFNENLDRASRSRDSINRGDDEFAGPERLVAGLLVFARLVREHFGVRGRRLADWAIDYVGNSLVTIGLKAMHEGDREFARQCYLSSIRKRPLMLKTYVRLAWAVLPASVTGMLSSMLPPRLQRSLSGPPFHGLQDRTE